MGQGVQHPLIKKLDIHHVRDSGIIHLGPTPQKPYHVGKTGGHGCIEEECFSDTVPNYA